MKSNSLFTFTAAVLANAANASLHSLKPRNITTSTNGSTLLSNVIDSIGGLDTLGGITSFSYESLELFRSQTLTQNYRLGVSDQFVAEAGTQTLSFKISNNATLSERLDRSYRYGRYWYFAFPFLEPNQTYSLVVQDGTAGYACFNEGQNSFYVPDPNVALGYADTYLTDYLINRAHQYALPWLLQQFQAAQSSLVVQDISDEWSHIVFPAITHPQLGLTLLVNSTTLLPHAVRSYEQHVVFGNSTNDVLFTNYSSVHATGNSSLMLPHRMMTVYNSLNVIEDFIIDQININPTFPSKFFDALPPAGSQTTPTTPSQSLEYPRSEVHEFFEAGLWGGPFGMSHNTSNVVVQYPIPGLDALKAIYVGPLSSGVPYNQLLVEFDDGLLITDAAPHRSKIVLDWVRENMPGKQIKYVVPTHHHRDHSGGISDYVAAGASIVAPEVSKPFWSGINGGNVSIITYSESAPFIKQDDTVQFRSIWHHDNPHAEDWNYDIVGPSCPDENSTMVVFIADVVNPGFDDAAGWDTGLARQWLVNAAQDGVPLSAMVYGAHAHVTTDGVDNMYPLQRVLDIVGFPYPVNSPVALRANGSCSS